MTAAGNYDYGRAGLFAVAIPQANPTVEAELQLLMPPGALVCAARCFSSAADPAVRLVAYLDNLAATFARFDTLRPDAAGFACTGSSYLVDPEREAGLLAAASDVIGVPVISATAAIRAALDAMCARRIVLVAPYTVALLEAAATYWRRAGLEVVASHRIDTGDADTRSIYGLGSGQAARVLADINPSAADAVLLSGTGMPTLSILTGDAGPSRLSSNLCLAWALLRAGGQQEVAGTHPLAMGTGWQARLAAALNPPHFHGATRHAPDKGD